MQNTDAGSGLPFHFALCILHFIGMKQRNLQIRTKQFALQVIQFCERLPNDETSKILRRQLLRAGTSVGQITAQHAGQNRSQLSSPKWEMSSKKRTSLGIGPHSCCSQQKR